MSRHLSKTPICHILSSISNDVVSLMEDIINLRFKIETIAHLHIISDDMITWKQLFSESWTDTQYSNFIKKISQGFPDNRQELDPNLPEYWEV